MKIRTSIVVWPAETEPEAEVEDVPQSAPLDVEWEERAAELIAALDAPS